MNASNEFVFRNEVLNADMKFNVNDGGVNTAAMFIEGTNGNVGIGTVIPTSRLHVNGGDAWIEGGYYGSLTVKGTGGAKIILRDGVDGNDAILGKIEAGMNNRDLLITAELSTGSLRLATAGAWDHIVITPTGDVGMGKDNPSHILEIDGVGRSTSSAWATSSDKRVKENINNLESGLSQIMQLRPVTYNYISEYTDVNTGVSRETQMGFIAKEVKEVCPSMVEVISETYGDKTIDDFNILNLSDLSPLLVKAVQEQQAQIELLIKQNQELIERISILENQ